MNLKEIEVFLKETRVRKNSRLHTILTTILSGGNGYTLVPKNNGGWHNHTSEVIDFLQTFGAGYLVREREEITGNGFIHFGYLITMDEEAIKEFDELRAADKFLYSNMKRILNPAITRKKSRITEITKFINSMETKDIIKDFVMYSEAINQIQIWCAYNNSAFTIEGYNRYCRKDKFNSHERWFYYMENREAVA